jgi:hypothetical protein
VNADPVALDRGDCYQILEALDHAADLAATIASYATQIEIEDAYGLVRDHVYPDLPEL